MRTTLPGVLATLLLVTGTGTRAQDAKVLDPSVAAILDDAVNPVQLLTSPPPLAPAGTMSPTPMNVSPLAPTPEGASSLAPGVRSLSFANTPGFGTQLPQIPPGTFGGASQSRVGLAGVAQSGIPMMIGDQGADLTIRQFATLPTTPTIPQPFPPPTPNPPPSPRQASALVPSVRGLKIAENQSPRPQDRIFFSYNAFSDVNQSLNQRLGAPVTDISVYREIFGLEKTFADGDGSIGLRLPLNTLTSRPTVPARFKQYGGTSTALGDLSIFAKYILAQDRETGSLISTGFAITPTTGPDAFAGANYIGSPRTHTTLMQPFIGYLWVRDRFYLQGFSAFEFPVNPAQVTYMYNDIGMGYFLIRNFEPGRMITGLAPTFEAHVNTPLNHRDVFNPNDPAGSPDVVNLTYGLNTEFYRNSLFTFGFVTPVTGPRPFSLEFLLLLNIRFGRSARQAPPPVISG